MAAMKCPLSGIEVHENGTNGTGASDQIPDLGSAPGACCQHARFGHHEGVAMAGCQHGGLITCAEHAVPTGVLGPEVTVEADDAHMSVGARPVKLNLRL